MTATKDNLPWQAELWSRVNEARRGGRLAHALLLAGPAGVGKRRFARRLAASLMCEARADDGRPCGVCRGCVQVAAGSHPNLTWMTREFNEKTEKEKRDISMDQLRTMMERLSLSSHYGQARVVVIDPADALNVNGVNALLKTVEEPPAGLHILLISERPMALAPTLRSRCQRLTFQIPPAVEAQAWLRDQVPNIDAAAALLEANGAPLAALEARESGASELHRTWREQLLAVANQKVDPLVAAGRLAPAGSKLSADMVQDWLRQFQRTLHHLLRSLAGVSGEPMFATVAVRLGAGHIEQLLMEIIESQRRVHGNANPQLAVESLMISWWRRNAP